MVGADFSVILIVCNLEFRVLSVRAARQDARATRLRVSTVQPGSSFASQGSKINPKNIRSRVTGSLWGVHNCLTLRIQLGFFLWYFV